MVKLHFPLHNNVQHIVRFIYPKDLNKKVLDILKSYNYNKDYNVKDYNVAGTSGLDLTYSKINCLSF